MNIRLITIAMIAVGAFLAVALLTLGLYYTHSARDDSTLINYAGRQRYRFFEMVTLSLELEKSRDEAARRALREEIHKNIEIYEDNFRILRFGDRALVVDAPTKPEIVASIEQNYSSWRTLRPIITGAADGVGLSSDFIRAATSHVKAVEKTVDLIDAHSRRKTLQYQAFLITTAFFSFAVVVIAAYVVSRRILSPLAAATEGVRRIGEGDLDARLEKNYDDEFGLLADGYNAMTEALRRSIGNYDELLRSIPDAMIETDASGTVRYCNRTALAMTGRAEADVVGRPIEGFVPPEARAECAELLKEVLGGRPVMNFQLPFQTKDGKVAILEVNAAPLRTEDRVAGALLAARDIAQRDAAVAALERARVDAEANAERLRKTVAELEAFAQIAVRREIRLKEIKQEHLRLKAELEGLKRKGQ